MAAAAPSAPAVGGANQRRAGPRGLAAWAPVLALVVTAGVLVALYVAAYPRISPVDEVQHIDSLYKGAQGQIVRAGDRLGPGARAELDARGIEDGGPPAGLYNNAFSHPPTYYMATGLLARALQRVAGLDSLVTAGRLVGAVWLAGGLVLLWVLGRRVGAPPSGLLGVLLLVASAPAILHFSATINPEAASLLVGGVVVWAVARWAERRDGIAVLAAAGAFAAAVKLTNLLIVAAGVLYLCALASTERRPEERGLARVAHPGGLAAAGALGGAAALVAVTWLVAVAALARADPSTLPMAQDFAVEAISWREVVGHIAAFVTPLTFTHIPSELSELRVLPFTWVLDWLFLVGLLGPLLLVVGRLQDRLFAAAVGVVLLLGAPGFVLLNFVTQGAYFAVPRRYGIVLTPALVILAGVVLRARYAGGVTFGLGVVAVLTTVAIAL